MSGKQGTYSFSPVLFTDEEGSSLIFVIKPFKDKETLRDMIQCGGGEVVATPGDHGITLIPPEVEVAGDDEVYSAEYIKDCCKSSRLLDLKPYRLNAASRFPDTFDVMDVLLNNTSWSDALKGLPIERKQYPVHSSHSDSSYCSDDADDDKPELSTISSHTESDFRDRTEQTIRRAEPRSSDTELEKSEHCPEFKEVATKVDDGINRQSHDATGRSGHEDTNPGPSGRQLRKHRNSKMISFRETRGAKVSSSNPDGEVVSDDDDEMWNLSAKRPKTYLTGRTRKDYTRKEKLAIVKFISKYRFHKNVKGREMWQKAEAAQICPNRTWQSMKEHFIKQIMPNIETYDLSEEELIKFQNAFR